MLMPVCDAFIDIPAAPAAATTHRTFLSYSVSRLLNPYRGATCYQPQRVVPNVTFKAPAARAIASMSSENIAITST